MALVMPNIYATDFVISNNSLKLEDEKLIFKNNLYYIPINTLGFIIEANYSWNDKQNSFDITWHQKQVSIYPNCNYVLCNDKKISISSETFWKDESLYVPISIIRDLFEGSIFYDKSKDILSVKVQTKEFRSKVENPFNKINRIEEVDEIRINDLNKIDKKIDKKIDDTSKISELMQQFLENSYTKVEHGDKRTAGYTYYIDLYSKGEKLTRIFVMGSDRIGLIGEWGYYDLEKSLVLSEVNIQQ